MTTLPKNKSKFAKASRFAFEVAFGILVPCFSLYVDMIISSIGSGFGFLPVSFSSFSPVVVYGAAASTMVMLLLRLPQTAAFQAFRAGWLVFGAMASLWLGLSLLRLSWSLLLFGGWTTFLASSVYFHSARAWHWWQRYPAWLLAGLLLPIIASAAAEIGERRWIGNAEATLSSAESKPDQVVNAMKRLGTYPFRVQRHVRPICNYLLGAQSGPTADIPKEIIAAARDAIRFPDPLERCERADN